MIRSHTNCPNHRAQAGLYDLAKELAEKGKKMEEDELGKRPERMAEVLYLMAYVADEVPSRIHRCFVLVRPWNCRCIVTGENPSVHQNVTLLVVNRT